MKKFLSVLLCVVLLITVMPSGVISAAPTNLAIGATAKSNMTKFFERAGGSLAVINDGNARNRTLGYWNGGNSWYGYEFATATTINHVYLLQDSVEDKSIRDFAVDVKLADGTWKRVAEVHHEANPGQAAKEHFYFAPVEVKEVRVIGNNAYVKDPNFFSISELEVYNDPSVTGDYTGIQKAPSVYTTIQLSTDAKNLAPTTTAYVDARLEQQPVANVLDGNFGNRCIPYFKGNKSLNGIMYYEFKFATPTEINSIYAFTDAVETGRYTKSIAFDVQDENGYWVRVAEYHGLTEPKKGTNIIAYFEKVKAKVVRISAHAHANSVYTTGKDIQDVFFSLTEVEIYNAPEVTEDNYATVTAGTTYVIPEYEPKGPVSSLEIEDISIIEGTKGYYNGEDYYYNNFYPNFKVTLNNGEVLTSTLGSVYFNDEWHSLQKSTTQYEEPWIAGNTYEATGSILGVSETFNVTITESPVASLEIEDISIIEGTNGFRNGEVYYYSNFYPNFKVTLNNGEVLTSTLGSVYFNDEWHSLQKSTTQYEEPWIAGNTYEATGSILGVSETFNVTITESPVASLEIEDISIIEGTNGFRNGEVYYYSNLDPNFKVTLNNGEVLTSNSGSVYFNDERYYLQTSDQIFFNIQLQEPWIAGNTYEVTGSILGFSSTFNVTITESPVERVEIDDISLIEGIQTNEDIFFDQLQPSYTVIFKDGTEKKMSGGSALSIGGYYICLDFHYDSGIIFESGKTYQILGSFGVVTDTFNVLIKENPITDIEIIKLPNKTAFLDGEVIDIFGAEFRIFYNDQTYEDVKVTTHNKYLDCNLSDNINLYIKKLDLYTYADVYYENEKIIVVFAEQEIEIDVTILENSIEEIEISENKKPIITVRNSDGSLYELNIFGTSSAEYGDGGLEEVESMHGIILHTDRGLFQFDYCIGYDGMCWLEYRNPTTQKTIKTNKISGFEWLDVSLKAIDAENIFSALDITHYNGTINAENIDAIIMFAMYIQNIENYIVTGAEAKKIVYDVFGKDIDLTLSKNYNIETDEYVNTNGGYGGYSAIASNVEYKNGEWTVALQNTWITDTRIIKFDDNHKITFFNTVSEINLNVLKEPNKTEYYVGEEFDAEGLEIEVEVIYADGSKETKEIITDGYLISGFDSNTAGEKLITVKFFDAKTTFVVTVIPSPEHLNYILSNLTYTISNNKVAILDCEPFVEGYVVIPSVIDGYPVTKICDFAFRYCDLITSITIPDSVISIGDESFYGCVSLESVEMSKNLKTLGYHSFYGCESLKSITIPEGVTKIPQQAFYNCKSLTSVTIGNSVTTIGDYAFYNCTSLTSVTIPDSVTTIGYGAFGNCISLTSATIGNSVTTIGDDAFLYCTSLTSVTIGNSVTTIGSWAFRDCTSLTSVTIPDSVTTIGDSAFYNCTSLTSVTIGNSVTSISDRAFTSCSSLTIITIPDSVTTIGNSAFGYCTSLTDVYYNGTSEDAEKISIGSNNSYLTNATWHYSPKSDINGDYTVDETDYQYIADVYTGKIKVENKAEICDMNGDGKLDIRDIIAINEILNA